MEREQLKAVTIKHCAGCGNSLGTYQSDLYSAAKKCTDCLTKDRIAMMLNALPDEDDWEWERLSEWEQNFLPSIRQQFAKKGVLTEAQYQPLERIWEKMNR